MDRQSLPVCYMSSNYVYLTNSKRDISAFAARKRLNIIQSSSVPIQKVVSQSHERGNNFAKNKSAYGALAEASKNSFGSTDRGVGPEASDGNENEATMTDGGAMSDNSEGQEELAEDFTIGGYGSPSIYFT